jgi:branched-chain amino acid transport system permease protein
MLVTTFAGLTPGVFYGIIGILLTLMSQLTRTVNFSQMAVGMFGGYVGMTMIQKLKVDMWLAAFVGLIIAAALSGLIGWIIATWLPNAQIAARSAITVAALLIIVSISSVLFGANHSNFKPLLQNNIAEIPVGDVKLFVSDNLVVLLIFALVIIIGSSLLLKRTMFGVRLRAISDRQAAAELIGVNVKVLNVGVWVVSGAVISIAISFMPNTISNDYISFSLLVIAGSAAALVGAFKNLWLALVGGVLIGVLQGLVASLPALAAYKEWVTFIIILVFLLWNQRKEVWDVAR